MGAARLRFASEIVGAHSLRSCGAMDMHIANVPNQTFLYIEWCHLLGIVVYTKQQISSFSTGVLVRIALNLGFGTLE